MIRSAPAKFNRFLSVLGRRPDGFHDLELVTTVLDGVPGLTDILEGEPADALSLALSGPTAEGLVVDEGNLVLRAWRLLEQAAGRPLPARLHLEKRIPHGAGLGGGSSDAAAALGLGNELFGLGLPARKLLDLASTLGSDVPLFLLGGTTLGLGRGERVFPLRPIPLEPILIVHPGLHVGTPSVYRAIASVGYPFPEPCPSLPAGAAPPWRNDLTGAAIWVCPPLAEVRRALLDAGGEPLLCGSGSCWAARFPSPAERDAARQELSETHPLWRTWSV
ncbi:MAG TPA: 4-(cytidine 5'-diphospho)-2-C-methyl-D-erythritol kinase [Holophaga sp.]|nr:4-(cytidine 5'-diphospho)-2-C-methyl-D-erythritol kinase [Holophaga sp.]HPS66488.1 4-(cytidine 5'-diphospho)-2-C-methyl-D-erythritol kinase [Holophaga sp.]